MSYKIYELIGKEKHEPDGYNMKTITTYKLKEINEWEMQNSYINIQDAYKDIEKHKELLKSKILTILPIVNINWDGEIS